MVMTARQSLSLIVIRVHDTRLSDTLKWYDGIIHFDSQYVYSSFFFQIMVPQLRGPLLGHNYPAVANVLSNILTKLGENIKPHEL